MKNLKITPPRSVASILCNYMLGAVGLTGITHEPGRGMPADTVSVDRQDLVLSFTCLDAPHFRSKVRALARTQARDVVLIRCCRSEDVFPLNADVTLAGGGLAPFDLRDLDVYRHTDHTLWLVPLNYGPSIELTPEGLVLNLVPPYSTALERAHGIYQSTVEISAELFPQAVL